MTTKMPSEPLVSRPLAVVIGAVYVLALAVIVLLEAQRQKRLLQARKRQGALASLRRMRRA